MTQQNPDDPAERLIRSTESWWEKFLRDIRISLPVGIFIFAATFVTWQKLDAMQRTLSSGWTVDMQAKFVEDTQEANGWNAITNSWNWKHANVYEVQAEIKKRNGQ